jgi:hypothetical protein
MLLLLPRAPIQTKPTAVAQLSAMLLLLGL